MTSIIPFPASRRGLLCEIENIADANVETVNAIVDILQSRRHVHLSEAEYRRAWELVAQHYRRIGSEFLYIAQDIELKEVARPRTPVRNHVVVERRRRRPSTEQPMLPGDWPQHQRRGEG
jgi:hypothetical protein